MIVTLILLPSWENKILLINSNLSTWSITHFHKRNIADTLFYHYYHFHNGTLFSDILYIFEKYKSPSWYLMSRMIALMEFELYRDIIYIIISSYILPYICHRTITQDIIHLQGVHLEYFQSFYNLIKCHPLQTILTLTYNISSIF